MKLEHGEPVCNYGHCEAPPTARGITNCIHCGKELHERDGAWFTWDAPADGGVAQDYIGACHKETTKP